MSDAHAPALRFDDVHVDLGRRAVLRGVAFELARGEVAGVLGRNGAGKTTLLRAAARGIAPRAGAIELFGAPLAALSRRALAQRVAVVPQDLHVPFPFSVAELVLMGRAPHQPLLGFESPRDVELARRALARLGIESLADRSIEALSGGERQLVLLARALVQEPALLLLDEPTAFLDLHHRALVLRIVRELVAERGTSALVVSHDVTLAARACDRLLLLHEGRIARAGRPRDVLDAGSLEQVFGLDAAVVDGPDGAPLVVPRIG
ncbi:MAG: ABC transporter ATP-binding protein [Myxococcota bacterium]